MKFSTSIFVLTKPSALKKTTINLFQLLLGISCSLLSSTSLAAEDDWLTDSLGELPSAITPTRIQKSTLELPVAVSVIDREFIESSGAQTLAELFAFVPGMAFAFRGYQEQSIAYHGLNSVNPKRMQVLIDGMSFYEAGLALSDWHSIPVSVAQVERVEVTRSPSAAVYGSNSFSGIINIITRSVDEQESLRLQVFHSSDNTTQFAASKQLEYEQHAVSIQYDYINDQGFSDEQDNSELHKVKLRHGWESNDWQSKTQISYVEMNADGEKPDEIKSSLASQHDVYFQNELIWQAKESLEVKFNQYFYHKQKQDDWKTCLHPSFISDEFSQLYQTEPQTMQALLTGQISIADAPSLSPLAQAAIVNYLTYGGPAADSICGSAENSIKQMRKQAEVQLTWVVNDQIKLLSGGYWRQDRLRSNVYIQSPGWISFDSTNVFVNLEYRANPDWLFDFAVMNESNARFGDSTSPRAAVNYQLCEHCSLRANYSYTERMPGEFEQNGQFKYEFINIEPNPYQLQSGYYFQSVHAEKRLDAEKMRALELGYHYYNWNNGIDLDISLFHQQMEDIINQGVTSDIFNFSNDLNIDLTGMELELNWKPNAQHKVKFSWSELNWQYENSNKYNKNLFTPQRGVTVFHYYLAPSWNAGMGAIYSNVEQSGELYQLQSYLRKPINLSSNNKLAIALKGFYSLDRSETTYKLAEFDTNWLVSLNLELTWQ